MAVRLWGLWRFSGGISSTKSRVVSTLGLRWNSCERSYSGKSSGGEDSVDEAAAAAAAESNAPNNRIEQALKEIRIQSAAPDWLPFFPGVSFWIHPDQIAVKKPEKPSGPLLDPANDREILAMVMPMGWPTSTAAGDAMNPESDSTN
ncbi:unnamed protein product [Calypogeia fissa]